MKGIHHMENDLLTALTEYVNQDYYPFHMPGHKRNKKFCQIENPYQIDITEIDGFDNLHDAQGILKTAMETAAEIYHAEETHFLVNGSSSGILAAICACTKPGDKILIARNCHKSVYHALYLQNLEPVYLYPNIKQGILSEVLLEDVKKAMYQYPEIRTAVIVSPSYEGVVSDIKEIAAFLHSRNCLLIVDEAHGAHFGFAEGFPETAVRLGADFVIQSVHKTLPSLTQTALLHIGKSSICNKNAEQIEKNGVNEIDRKRLYRYLSIFQTSSPSYLFMASIQKSLLIVKEHAEILFSELLKNIAYLRKKTEALKFIHILSLKNTDPSKLNIFIDEKSGRNGHWLYSILLKKYHLQMEMETLRYVLAMTSIADTKEGFVRLANALIEIDQGLSCQNKENYDNNYIMPKPPMAFCSISMALDSKKEMCFLDNAIGFVSAEYIYLYPPGIPLLVPGEVFTEEYIVIIKKYLSAGLTVKGVEKNHVYIIKNTKEA